MKLIGTQADRGHVTPSSLWRGRKGAAHDYIRRTGKFYYRYMVVDVWSRMIVASEVHEVVMSQEMIVASEVHEVVMSQE